ncbi:MAG: MauE/DoxX family redox-associated membrane protein [Syntrophobacteraceae bacterium]
MNHDRLESRAVKYPLLLARLLLGAVFIAAGAGKLLHPHAFAAIVSNYQILPAQLVNGAAVILPWLETLVGLLILSGIWLPGALSLADMLLFIFLAALASAAARGIDIDCGCFSVKPAASPNFIWYLSRDLLFLLLAAAITVQTFSKMHSKQTQREGNHE